MASVALNSVNKAFDGQAVVRDLTLDVADGELMVLVGPSGCGKSTVLRLVAGLEYPTSGRVLIDGVDVTDLSPQDRDLAMVFQSYALYPHLSVRENLAFGLRMRRTPPASTAVRVTEAARLLGIEDLLDRKPSQLSGGQRQRVALGRAIVREPKAFLLDEPLSNLDPALRVETRTQLARLHRRLNATMLYVTHDQEEAMTLGTRVAVMKDGELQQTGTPLEVYTRPVNMFVGRFVGSPAMNFVRAAWGGGWHGFTARFAGEPDRAVLGVRPHDISLVSAGDGEADVRGVIESVEHLGNSQLVHVAIPATDGDLHAGRPRAAAERLDVTPPAAPDLIRVVVSGDADVTRDEQVGLRFRRDRVHVFDERTGNRVD